MKDKPPIRVIRSAQQVGHGGVKPVRGGVLQGGPPQSRLQQSLGSVSPESVPAEPYQAEDEKQGTPPHVEVDAVGSGNGGVGSGGTFVIEGEVAPGTFAPQPVGGKGGRATVIDHEVTKALAFYRKHMERRRAQRKKRRKAEKEELKRLRELVKEKP